MFNPERLHCQNLNNPEIPTKKLYIPKSSVNKDFALHKISCASY